MAQEAAGQTLQATALVHEAWLRLFEGKNQNWQSRGHFFGAAAEAMRRILIERARRKMRLKHGGGQIAINIEALSSPWAASPPADAGPTAGARKYEALRPPVLADDTQKRDVVDSL